MDQVNRLLTVAASQIGVEEDPPGSNHIKYNTAYWGREVSGDAYPWCMAFVWWCFDEAEIGFLFYGGGKTASCTRLMNWAKNVGQFVTRDFRPGDVILYNFDDTPDADHTGVCVCDNGTTVTVIEGNTNDRVEQTERNKRLILGAWRPQFEDTPTGETVEVHLPELRKGSKGDSVTAMQALLQESGYWVGPDGCDGDFGPNTDTALRRYQQDKALGADGICGICTWSRLLGV